MSDDFPIPVPDLSAQDPDDGNASSGGVSSGNGASVLVEDLELSIRSTNVLLTLGITTLGELSKLTEIELLRTKNCGRKVLKELNMHLAEHGLRLGM